ncbi:MAG: hypothetical protein WDA16_05860 [Candidatus Thermoplasmatota archaeon]
MRREAWIAVGVIAILALLGAFFFWSISSKPTGWQIFVTSEHPESETLIAQSKAFDYETVVSPNVPWATARGAFEGRFTTRQVLRVTIGAAEGTEVSISYLAFGGDTPTPQRADCVMSNTGWTNRTLGGLGKSSVFATNESCTFEFALARLLDNPRGPEIVWEARPPYPPAPAPMAIRFAAQRID